MATDPEQTRLSVFGLMADRRYYDRPVDELVEVERRVRAYEQAVPGRRVVSFADWQVATGDTNEARFVRWEAVRADAEAYLHRIETGRW